MDYDFSALMTQVGGTLGLLLGGSIIGIFDGVITATLRLRQWCEGGMISGIKEKAAKFGAR